jgi:phosphoglycolate phosphatase
MVGDTIVDVETARRADVPCLAVSFGYSDVPGQALGADALIDHYRELNGAIGALHDRLKAHRAR